MRSIAVIDLGTHNCRLTVADIAGADFTRRRVYSKIVKLGEGASRQAIINQKAQKRTITALQRMADIIHEEKITEVYPLATEGARMTNNAGHFFRVVKARTGLNFTIISPQEEVRLSVLATAPFLNKRDRAVVFDIGGGSTEVILVEKTGQEIKIADWVSLPFGVVRGRDRFGSNLKSPDFEKFIDEVAHAFAPFFKRNAKFFHNPFVVIGTSGTVTTLAACCLELRKYSPEAVDGVVIPIEDLFKFAGLSSRTPLFARQLNPLIGPGRAEYLPSGCAILEGLFKHIPAQALIAADRGLREGIIYGLVDGAPEVSFAKGRKS